MAEIIDHYYQGGGSLPANIPSYVEREADTLLYNYLREGHFCYILAARQMGKSSLRVRVMNKLIKDDYLCCALDISKIGKDVSGSDEWYYTLVDVIRNDLKLNIDVPEWWEKEKNITPVYRFFKFMKEIVLQQTSKKITFFFDEIDSVLSLNKTLISTDDFFASIRSIYNERADNPEFSRLNFVIIGVASPNELMNDATRTPFNIGRSIPLNNITIEEARVLEKGLSKLPFDSHELLKEVFHWSNGQPFLTQKICETIENCDVKQTNAKLFVKENVDTLFLNPPLSNSNNINLLNIQNRIEKNRLHGVDMLSIYTNVLKNNSIKEDTGNLAQIYLRLTGLVRREYGLLLVNNNIYKSKLNQVWAADLYSRISKPFKAHIDEWVENNKSSDKALRGDALERFSEWCNKQNKLTPLENEFLNFSFHIRNQEELKKQFLIEERQKLEAEQKLYEEKRKQLEEEKQLAILAVEKSEKEKANAEAQTIAAKEQAIASEKKRKNILTATTLMAAVLAIAGIYYYTTLRKEIKDSRKAVIEARKATAQLDIFTKVADSLTKENKITEQRLIENSQKAIADSIKNQKYAEIQNRKLNETIALLINDRNKIEIEKREINDSIDRMIVKFEAQTDSLSREREVMLVTIANLKKTKAQLDEEYSLLNANRWLYQFDTVDRNKIVNQIIFSTDSVTKKSLLTHYQNVARARETVDDDPNRAFWMTLEELKKNKNDTITLKQAKYIGENALFYSDKQPLFTNYPDSISQNIEYVERIEDGVHLGIVNDTYSIINIPAKKIIPLAAEIAGYSYLYCISRKERKIFLVTGPNQMEAFDLNGKSVYKKAIPLSGARLKNTAFIFYGGNNKLFFKDEVSGSTNNPTQGYIVTELDMTTLKQKTIDLRRIRKTFQNKILNTAPGKASSEVETMFIDYDETTNLFVVCLREIGTGVLGIYTADSDLKTTEIGGSLTQQYKDHDISMSPYHNMIIFTPQSRSPEQTNKEVILLSTDGTSRKIQIPGLAYFNYNSPDNNYFVFEKPNDGGLIFFNSISGKTRTFINTLWSSDYGEIRNGVLYTYEKNEVSKWDIDDPTQPFSIPVWEQKYVDPFRKDFENSQTGAKKPPLNTKQAPKRSNY